MSLTELFSLQDQVAIVTGAGRGLGRAIAIALAEAGADVALAARGAGQLEETAALVRQRGRRALVVPGDVTRPDAAETLVARTVADLGRLDILVNNAGVLQVKPLIDVTPEEWHTVVDSNLTSTFLLCRAAGRHMIAQRRGRVINVASVDGIHPLARCLPYSAAKAGVLSLTQGLAAEWARYNVRVNAVAPGYFHTPMVEDIVQQAGTDVATVAARDIPVGRIGDPRELAAMVVCLAAPVADYMTGSVIVMDGGHLAKGGVGGSRKES